MIIDQSPACLFHMGGPLLIRTTGSGTLKIKNGDGVVLYNVTSEQTFNENLPRMYLRLEWPSEEMTLNCHFGLDQLPPIAQMLKGIE